MLMKERFVLVLMVSVLLVLGAGFVDVETDSAYALKHRCCYEQDYDGFTNCLVNAVVGESP